MQQVVCDGRDCGKVIGPDEEFVEVSALRLRGRPPKIEQRGAKAMQLCVDCAPELVTPRDTPHERRPQAVE